MIDLQNLKNAINDGGFSEEAKALMLPIVDAAIARGSMAAEEKKKLQNVMDVEIDQDTLEQSANEEAAEAIETFLAETDAATQTAADNTEDLEREASEESQKIKDELANSAQIQNSVQPSEPQVSPMSGPIQSEAPPLQMPQSETPWQPPTQ